MLTLSSKPLQCSSSRQLLPSTSRRLSDRPLAKAPRLHSNPHVRVTSRMLKASVRDGAKTANSSSKLNEQELQQLLSKLLDLIMQQSAMQQRLWQKQQQLLEMLMQPSSNAEQRRQQQLEFQQSDGLKMLTKDIGELQLQQQDLVQQMQQVQQMLPRQSNFQVPKQESGAWQTETKAERDKWVKYMKKVDAELWEETWPYYLMSAVTLAIILRTLLRLTHAAAALTAQQHIPFLAPAAEALTAAHAAPLSSRPKQQQSSSTLRSLRWQQRHHSTSTYHATAKPCHSGRKLRQHNWHCCSTTAAAPTHSALMPTVQQQDPQQQYSSNPQQNRC